jgi:hypothetical protein
VANLETEVGQVGQTSRSRSSAVRLRLLRQPAITVRSARLARPWNTLANQVLERFPRLLKRRQQIAPDSSHHRRTGFIPDLGRPTGVPNIRYKATELYSEDRLLLLAAHPDLIGNRDIIVEQ